MALMRSISGVRGIVGEDLDAGVVYAYTLAFASLQIQGPILLARDARPHGSRLLSAAAQALAKARRSTLNADLIPTPTAQFLVARQRMAGAIVMTASHNPLEYNGMKFIGPDGCFLDADASERLFALADAAEVPAEIPDNPVRGRALPDAAGRHILDILDLSSINIEAIHRRQFRVAVDAVNGAGSLALPALLEALGCTVIRLHTTPDGEFPRGPEPLPENLGALSQVVTAEGAQLGLATDPDGDRLALIDETGTPAGEELTQVLAVAGFLQRTRSRRPVVTNLSSSQLLDYVAGRHGVPVVRSAVGEVNVVARMRTEGSEIGGEGNGGVILAESHLGRDALVGAALVLDRLVQDERPLSGILAELPQFVMLKERISVDGLSADRIYQDVSRRFPDGEHITEDGLKIQWEDRWFHIRESNTEPIMRIYAEGPTLDIARELVASVRSICVAAGVSS